MVNQYLPKEARTYKGIKRVFSINCVRKIGEVHAKNETRPPTCTVHINKLKLDKRLQRKSQN